MPGVFILTQTREQRKTLLEMKIVGGPFHHPKIFSSQRDSFTFNTLAFELEGYSPFVILFFAMQLNPDQAWQISTGANCFLEGL